MLDRSKIGRKSSRKGKNRERKFANALSLWWTSGKDHQAFRRTPLSGGWLRKHTHGDTIPVTPEAELFPFVIEIKDRKEVENIDFADLLINEKCPILEWWKTLTETIQNNPLLHAGKKRLLVIHKRRKDYCMIGVPEMTFLNDHIGKLPYMKIWTPYAETLIVFPAKELFSLDPEALRLSFLETPKDA